MLKEGVWEILSTRTLWCDEIDNSNVDTGILNAIASGGGGLLFHFCMQAKLMATIKSIATGYLET